METRRHGFPDIPRSFVPMFDSILARSTNGGLLNDGLLIWAAWMVFYAAGPAQAVASPPAPQVAGFDRFGRHGDIDAHLAGRLLVAELGCTACHATNDLSLGHKPGPDFSGIGARLNRDWIAQFVADPSAVKPGTTMPTMLAGQDVNRRQEIAEAIAAYLSTFRKPIAEVKGSGALPVPHQFWLRGDSVRGRELFHQVGCVACHAPDADHETTAVAASPTDQLLDILDEDELAELGLLAASRPGPAQSLGDPAAKYTAHSLTSFLLDPETVRPSARMPNLKLSPTEAADIAAYLIEKRSSTTPVATTNDKTDPANATDIDLGRQWFVRLRCNVCHSGTDSDAVAMDRPASLASLAEKIAGGGGCVAPVDDNHSQATANVAVFPRYWIDNDQRSAIHAAIAAPIRGAENDRLLFSMLQLNCVACHQRDALGGVARDRRPYFETVGNADLGDEGRFPPPLESVEHKLQPAWLNRVLQGNGAIRPHMLVRMPKLPGDWSKRLATEFQASRERITPRPQLNPKNRWPQAADTQATDVGRLMMDSGCVQCHLFRGESLPGVIGVDLSGIGDRMQPDWFLALLRDPGAVKPRTRMPNFFPDGASQHPELLDGDRDRQIAAMWGYLTDIAKQPLPAKIEEARSADYELRPTDRPIILRTFMREAGTHAIAVGFPQSIHIAVDASQPRLAAMWRGRFLDAQGTWFVRAAPPADPLGDSLVTLPPLASFTLEPASDNAAATKPNAEAGLDASASIDGIAAAFRGYRIDQRGVPTFLYRFGSFDVEDTFQPSAENQRDLVRRVVVKSQVGPAANGVMPTRLLFRVHAGTRLNAADPPEAGGQSVMVNETGLMVAVNQAVAKSMLIKSEAGTDAWVLPIAEAGPNDQGAVQTWELRYSW